MTSLVLNTAPPAFCPPNISQAIDRRAYVPPKTTTPYISYVQASRKMKAKEVPINYLDEKLRFVLDPSSVAFSNSITSPTQEESDLDQKKALPLTDKYATEIFLDPLGHALRAQYEKGRGRQLDDARSMKSNRLTSKNASSNYTREKPLKADKLSYYPGRDKWLIEWQRARTYGLPYPQMHDNYGTFIQGTRNGEWVRGEERVQEKKLFDEGVNRG